MTPMTPMTPMTNDPNDPNDSMTPNDPKSSTKKRQFPSTALVFCFLLHLCPFLAQIEKNGLTQLPEGCEKWPAPFR